MARRRLCVVFGLAWRGRGRSALPFFGDQGLSSSRRSPAIACATGLAAIGILRIRPFREVESPCPGEIEELDKPLIQIASAPVLSYPILFIWQTHLRIR